MPFYKRAKRDEWDYDENYEAIRIFIHKRMREDIECRKVNAQIQDSRNFYYLMQGEKYFSYDGGTFSEQIEYCRIEYDIVKRSDMSCVFSEKEQALKVQEIMLTSHNIVLDLYEVEISTQVNFKETKHEQIMFVQN